MKEEDIKKLINETIKKELQSNLFTARKLTDTPTDALQVVPRKYVTMNGTSSARPTASVVGQFYLDMTLAAGAGKPIWWNGTGFIDATGTYV